MSTMVAGRLTEGGGRPDAAGWLDHVAVVSDRPADLFATYERMGFRLSTLSRHAGALRPGEAPVPWGTGNRCAMFRSGYLELLAIVDPAMPCGIFPTLLQRYAGIHIVAFGSMHLDAMAERMKGQGIKVTGVAALERELETPQGMRTGKFSLLRMEDAETPEARMNILTHHTPDYLWQPQLMDHPNGAVALNAVLVSVADVDEAARRYERILGIAATRDGAVRCFAMASGEFRLVAADALGTVLPGFEQSVVPQCIAVSIGVADPARTRAFLERQAVPFAEIDGRLVVPSRAAMGAAVVFERHPE